MSSYNGGASHGVLERAGLLRKDIQIIYTGALPSARYSNEEMFRASYDWYITHRDEVLGRAGRSPHASAVKQGVLRLVSQALQLAPPR